MFSISSVIRESKCRMSAYRWIVPFRNGEGGSLRPPPLPPTPATNTPSTTSSTTITCVACRPEWHQYATDRWRRVFCMWKNKRTKQWKNKQTKNNSTSIRKAKRTSLSHVKSFSRNVCMDWRVLHHDRIPWMMHGIIFAIREKYREFVYMECGCCVAAAQ